MEFRNNSTLLKLHSPTSLHLPSYEEDVSSVGFIFKVGHMKSDLNGAVQTSPRLLDCIGNEKCMPYIQGSGLKLAKVEVGL